MLGIIAYAYRGAPVLDSTDEVEALALRVDRLGRVLDSLEKTVLGNRSGLYGYGSIVDDVETMQSEIASLTDESEQLRVEITQLRDDVSDIQSDIVDLKDR